MSITITLEELSNFLLSFTKTHSEIHEERVEKLKEENKELKDQFEAIEQSTESSAYLELEIERLKEENKSLNQYREDLNGDILNNYRAEMKKIETIAPEVEDIGDVRGLIGKLKEEINSLKANLKIPFTENQLDEITGYGMEHPDEIHDDNYLHNHLCRFLQERDEKEDWIDPEDIDKDWCDSWLCQNGEMEEFIDECLESGDEERISQSQAHDLKNFVMELHNEVYGSKYNDTDIVSAMVLTGKDSVLEKVKSELNQTNP